MIYLQFRLENSKGTVKKRMDSSQFLHVFIGLLVITNPLVALSCIIPITSKQSSQQKKQTALTATVAISVILIVMTWVGSQLLHFLGIRFEAFQTAGGIIVIILGYTMLNAEESGVKTSEEERHSSDSGAIIPLAFPLVAGPGGISAVIVTANAFPGMVNHAMISVACVLVASLAGLCIYFANVLEKYLGITGVNIFSRIGGLILLAIGIQIFGKGIKTFFPWLAG